MTNSFTTIGKVENIFTLRNPFSPQFGTARSTGACTLRYPTEKKHVAGMWLYDTENK